MALQRESHLRIPRKGIARPQSKFHSSFIHVSVSDYIFAESVHIFSWRRIGRPSWEYINSSQTQNVEIWTAAAQVLLWEYFVQNFRYCVFAMWNRPWEKKRAGIINTKFIFFPYLFIIFFKLMKNVFTIQVNLCITQLLKILIPVCAAGFALLNLPKGKSLGRSKPETNSSNEQVH